VEDWLRRLVTSDYVVVACWSETDAVLLPWNVFCRSWSAFCYPSSDDVIVFPLTEEWILAFSHEGTFYWRAK
jgi:hypothetical protein